MKVGIIRCMQTEDYCPGTTDFLMIKNRKGAFEGITEDIEIVGFINCGGCPAKKVVLRARELVKRGADTIAFASCIKKGTPIGYPCPFAEKMMELVKAASYVALREISSGMRKRCLSVIRSKSTALDASTRKLEPW